MKSCCILDHLCTGLLKANTDEEIWIASGRWEGGHSALETDFLSTRNPNPPRQG